MVLQLECSTAEYSDFINSTIVYIDLTCAPAQLGLSILRNDEYHLFQFQGDGAAAWAKTEASASFWPIGDATAPGTPSTHRLPNHPAPVDVGVVLGE